MQAEGNNNGLLFWNLSVYGQQVCNIITVSWQHRLSE